MKSNLFGRAVHLRLLAQYSQPHSTALHHLCARRSLDAYAHPWTCVVEFNPKYGPEDLNKVASVAISSAITSSEPVLAVGVLPD